MAENTCPPIHVDHTNLIEGPFATGPEVTKACLVCHPNAAEDVMKTEHFTWAGDQIELPGTNEVVQIGKRNLLNNFWYNGRSERYLTGDRIDPEGPVRINYPLVGSLWRPSRRCPCVRCCG